MYRASIPAHLDSFPANANVHLVSLGRVNLDTHPVFKFATYLLRNLTIGNDRESVGTNWSKQSFLIPNRRKTIT